MTFAICALAIVGVVEVGATCWLFRSLRRLDHVEDRLARLTEALRLLTETTESGFQATALEMSRLVERQAAAEPARVVKAATTTRASATRRVSAAKTPVRKARLTQPAAVAEDMSEGELRLRMHLAEAAGRM